MPSLLPAESSQTLITVMVGSRMMEAGIAHHLMEHAACHSFAHSLSADMVPVVATRCAGHLLPLGPAHMEQGANSSMAAAPPLRCTGVRCTGVRHIWTMHCHFDIVCGRP